MAAGSIDMQRHDVNFEVKVGSRQTLTLTLTDDSGCVQSLTCTCIYNAGTWKVWEPDGTLIINGAINYSCRAAGEITYTLAMCDATICDAGRWEGEVEYINMCCIISDQSDSFGFVIKESY